MRLSTFVNNIDVVDDFIFVNRWHSSNIYIYDLNRLINNDPETLVKEISDPALHSYCHFLKYNSPLKQIYIGCYDGEIHSYQFGETCGVGQQLNPDDAGDRCVDCPVNFYNANPLSTTACSACPTGLVSEAGASVCTADVIVPSYPPIDASVTPTLVKTINFGQQMDSYNLAFSETDVFLVGLDENRNTMVKSYLISDLSYIRDYRS